MKNYSTEIMKLIALLVITPILVMIYTHIEKRFVASATDQFQGGFSGATPVAIGLINRGQHETIQPADNNDYILVNYTGSFNNSGDKERGLAKNAVATR
ncbi:MAG: hypothetical protein H7258_07645 [Ferruginibacter sp.]|nr:hypothetical protein [Ferruginibacter sp.]